MRPRPTFCARRSSLEVFPVCSRRFPLFALSLFLALLLVPSRALAYDFIPKGLVYSADLDGSRYGAVAVAANQFDAACYALGKEPASISTSIRSKLSDPNYGGRFYDFSQAFYTQGWPLEDVPQWLPVYVWGSVEWCDLLLSDYQSVWYVTCTQSLRSGALVDFLAVLNGEDLGGGGSGDTPDLSGGIDVEIPYDSTNYLCSSQASQKNAFRGLSGTVTAHFNSAQASSISNYTYLVIGVGMSSQYNHGVSNGRGEILSFSTNVDPSSLTIKSNVSGLASVKASSYANYFLSDNDGILIGSMNGNTYAMTQNGVPSATQLSGWVLWYKVYNVADLLHPTPSVPSGTWPEPSSPAAPVEPTFPDPSTPTVQPDPVVTEPTVTWPSPTITIDPDPVPGTTPTGLDYTELLTRINDNLISIDSFARAINSNLNSLRSDLVNEFNGVVQGLRNIYTYLQHMDSVLERHCVHLQNKLEDVSVDIQNKIREMVRWLADELDFGSEVSGNSDLFGILSTISDKLGGGTYEPNPLKDENAYYEWLDDLWDRFLLGDNWQSSASSMSQSFGQLTSRFPFSVPWDIVALFRLFVHEPVTPVFDLPLYYSSEDSATVRVDLSAWDGVASVVRPLVFVIFALNLALLSRHLLAGFGADKGGL